MGYYDNELKIICIKKCNVILKSVFFVFVSRLELDQFQWGYFEFYYILGICMVFIVFFDMFVLDIFVGFGSVLINII